MESTNPDAAVAPDSAFVAWACLPLRPAGSGTIVDDTPERRFELDPNWRLAGPNRVTRVRCAADRVVDLVAQVREMAAHHDVPILWTLDRGVQPLDLADRLIALGLVPSPHNPDGILVMVRDAATPVAEIPTWLTFTNALASLTEFELTTRVQDGAFGGSCSPTRLRRSHSAIPRRPRPGRVPPCACRCTR